jgi:hypothetical protein
MAQVAVTQRPRVVEVSSRLREFSPTVQQHLAEGWTHEINFSRSVEPNDFLAIISPDDEDEFFILEVDGGLFFASTNVIDPSGESTARLHQNIKDGYVSISTEGNLEGLDIQPPPPLLWGVF